MRLSEFIEDTLYEIAVGVEHARLKARNYVAINPAQLDGELLTEKGYVEFDVSVVVGEANEASITGEKRATGEIKVATILKVGANGSSQEQSSSTAKAEQTHRVSFKVPVYMNANYRNDPLVQADAKALEALSDVGASTR
jgi:hypothetical protein